MYIAAAAAGDDDDDASWQYAWQNRLVRCLGITVIRDIVNAPFGTRGKIH